MSATRAVNCALMALNCSVQLWLGHYGVAVFHAFLPVLLVLLSEYAQDTTLQFGEIAEEHAAQEQATRDAQLRADRQKRETEQTTLRPPPAPCSPGAGRCCRRPRRPRARAG